MTLRRYIYQAALLSLALRGRSAVLSLAPSRWLTLAR
jgi:hypothetical protein